MILLEHRGIRSIPNSNKFDVGIVEEAHEDVGDGVLVKELEYEATATDAELQRRGGKLDPSGERAPLDAEANNEAAPVRTVEVPHSVNPFPHHGGGRGQGGVYWSSEEGDRKSSVSGCG